MKTIITNAFSIQMLSESADLGFTKVTAEQVAKMLQGQEFISAVGHADTAAVFSTILGQEIPMNRVSVSIDEDTKLIVGQVTGGRLPEGATTIPEGMEIVWWLVGYLEWIEGPSGLPFGDSKYIPMGDLL